MDTTSVRPSESLFFNPSLVPSYQQLNRSSDFHEILCVNYIKPSIKTKFRENRLSAVVFL